MKRNRRTDLRHPPRFLEGAARSTLSTGGAFVVPPARTRACAVLAFCAILLASPIDTRNAATPSGLAISAASPPGSVSPPRVLGPIPDARPFGVLYGWDIWALHDPTRGICLAAVRPERTVDACRSEAAFLARGIDLTVPNPYVPQLAPFRNTGAPRGDTGRHIRFAPEDMTVHLVRDTAATRKRRGNKEWSLGESNP